MNPENGGEGKPGQDQELTNGKAVVTAIDIVAAGVPPGGLGRKSLKLPLSRADPGGGTPPSTAGGTPAATMSTAVQGVADGPFPGWTQKVEPWPEPVDGRMLLDGLSSVCRAHVVMPKFTPETCALFTVHTYAYHLRDVTAYLGIESPLKRCGKSTLLAVLSALVNRAVVSSNISPSAFFRVIEEARPTLLIDEADTLLKGNDELRGILNSGYTKSTAFVVRVANQAGQNDEQDSGRLVEGKCDCARGGSSSSSAAGLAVYSCWCPKVMATIGHLPETLADRCIIIRMQRKTSQEQCERLRNLKGIAHELKRQCVRFVLENAERIAGAGPAIPRELNDRAADVWEPLFAIADIAGDYWPEQARQAAVALAENSTENNPIGTLFLDISLWFTQEKRDRAFTRELVEWLNGFQNHLWAERNRGRPINEVWLAQQLRPYRIRPRIVRIGETVSRGYYLNDFMDSFRRYISHTEFSALRAEIVATNPRGESNPATPCGREGPDRSGAGAMMCTG
jgi:hypothetical protein